VSNDFGAGETTAARADVLVERRGFELMAIGRCRSSDPNRWRNTAHSRQTLPSPSPFTPKPIRAANLAPKARRFDPSENHPWLASVVDAHRARLGAMAKQLGNVSQACKMMGYTNSL
jgi:hypothetical protein